MGSSRTQDERTRTRTRGGGEEASSSAPDAKSPPSSTSTSTSTLSTSSALGGPSSRRRSLFPLVELELDDDGIPTTASSIAVTSALRASGFLLARTALLPVSLQRRALSAARRYLRRHGDDVMGDADDDAVDDPPSMSSSPGLSRRGGRVLTHPTDPKAYAMLEGIESIRDDDDDEDDDDDDDDGDTDGGGADEHTTTTTTTTTTTMATATRTTTTADLEDWYRAAREARIALLRCIAAGMGMGNDDRDFLVRLHDEDNDSLRLLGYFRGDARTGNRCREHSDYGTLTLLLNDGVGGLEAYVDDDDDDNDDDDGDVDGDGGGGRGYVVVNIGSILSDWTGGELRATLHRVAGPASVGGSVGDDVADRTYRESLLRAVSVPRYSIAYFADPNGDVSIDAKLVGSSAVAGGGEGGNNIGLRVKDYIRWRSGGMWSDRCGVAFTSAEESRLANIR
ncbi:hypothetical protein ACHAW5_007550 [Stephanodiscus triporus]|uniref:Fe2OG dioxygenase domain-containing protein n=1 Tax=Stephanodiscus triporus TaxID=2934178 RepID=A0ABD3NTT7_9STRA